MRVIPFIPLFILINLRWLQPVPFGPPSPDDRAFELELEGIHHHPVAKSLIDLAVGDTVRVFMENTGCFHFSRGTIILAREASGFSASVRYDDLQTTVPGTAERRLTHAEIAELDLTLAILRPGAPQGYCTSTTIYQIAWGGVPESLVDSDCRIGRREANDERVPTVTFESLLWEVAEPLHQEWRRGQPVIP